MRHVAASSSSELGTLGSGAVPEHEPSPGHPAWLGTNLLQTDWRSHSLEKQLKIFITPASLDITHPFPGLGDLSQQIKAQRGLSSLGSVKWDWELSLPQEPQLENQPGELTCSSNRKTLLVLMGFTSQDH